MHKGADSKCACAFFPPFNASDVTWVFFFLPPLLFAASQGVEDKVERDAVSALPEQQATAAPATDNSTRHAVEDAVVYPSRLIYYLNRDSESPHHDLDTRVKNQAGEDQVRGGGAGSGNCVVIFVRLPCWVFEEFMAVWSERPKSIRFSVSRCKTPPNWILLHSV